MTLSGSQTPTRIGTPTPSDILVHVPVRELRDARARMMNPNAVTAFGKYRWTVTMNPKSASGQNVTLLNGVYTCTCGKTSTPGPTCEHIACAVFKHLGSDFDIYPRPPSKKFKRDYQTISKASKTERPQVLELLSELVQVLPHTPHTGRGRPSMPLSAKLYQTILKVYEGKGQRRAFSALKDNESDAKRLQKLKGHGAAAQRVKVLWDDANGPGRILNDPDMTPILESLITTSAYRASDTHFAIDGTGFSSTTSSTYYQRRMGTTSAKITQVYQNGKPMLPPQPKVKHDFVMAVFMAGQDSKLITAAGIYANRITDPNGALRTGSAEPPYFIPLYEQTKRIVSPQVITGDAAYGNYGNYMVEKLDGVDCWLLGKSTHGKTAGNNPFEAKMGIMHSEPARFMAAYAGHQNVESINHAVKQTTGDTLQSTNMVAMRNEVLCKLIIHNLRRLHHLRTEGKMTALDFADAYNRLQSSASIEVSERGVPPAILARYNLGPKQLQNYVDPAKLQATRAKARAIKTDVQRQRVDALRATRAAMRAGPKINP